MFPKRVSHWFLFLATGIAAAVICIALFLLNHPLAELHQRQFVFFAVSLCCFSWVHSEMHFGTALTRALCWTGWRTRERDKQPLRYWAEVGSGLGATVGFLVLAI